MVWINNAKIVAMFAVVIVHVAATFVLNSPIGSSNWWVGNLYESAARWSVPVFVMLSGALLLHPNKQESLSVFYKKRLSRILVPLIFWSLFYLLWASLKGGGKR